MRRWKIHNRSGFCACSAGHLYEIPDCFALYIIAYKCPRLLRAQFLVLLLCPKTRRVSSAYRVQRVSFSLVPDTPNPRTTQAARRHWQLVVARRSGPPLQASANPPYLRAPGATRTSGAKAPA